MSHEVKIHLVERIEDKVFARVGCGRSMVAHVTFHEDIVTCYGCKRYMKAKKRQKDHEVTK